MDTTKQPKSVISFCSGYAGIERGLQLTGLELRTLAYVEIEAFAAANLVAKMETGALDPAPIWSNLKTFPSHLFRDRVDILTGGYPCQPFSAAGKRAGKDDPRHLWPWIRQHIDTMRPVRCFFENVEGHISLGLREVIEDLEELGYKTTWGIFSASEVGAPHQRKRVYILADSKRDTIRQQSRGRGWENGQSAPFARVDGEAQPLADSSSTRSATRLPRPERSDKERHSEVANNSSDRSGWRQSEDQWATEPGLGRVVDGGADRVDRLRLLGNGVVPQTAARAWTVLDKEITK